METRLNASGLGRRGPISDWVTMPSALTGASLTYLIPRRISEVARCLATRSKPSPDPYTAWALLPVLAHESGEFGSVHSGGQLGKMCIEAMTGRLVLKDVTDLVAYGPKLSEKNKGIRRELSFGGGPTASTSQMLYPPANLLPDLLADLSNFLSSDLSTLDPLEVSVLTGDYAVAMHPFTDGNGRWSRLLSIASGHLSGGTWESMVAAALRKRGWGSVKHLLLSARHQGLDKYLSLAHSFENSLYSQFNEKRLFAISKDIVSLLAPNGSPEGWALYLLERLLWFGSLDASWIRQKLNCSSRKAEGLISGLEAASSGRLERSGGLLSAQGLLSRTLDVFDSTLVDLGSPPLKVP